MDASTTGVVPMRYFLTLCTSTGAARIPSHRNSLLVFHHILQVCDCSLYPPAIDGLGSFAGVFEADTKVGSSAASRLRRRYGSRSVANLGTRVGQFSSWRTQRRDFGICERSGVITGLQLTILIAATGMKM